MSQSIHLRLVVLLLTAPWLAAPVSSVAPAVLDAGFPEGRETIALEALETRALLGPGEGFRAVEVGRDPHTSHHVVAIRARETPHRHDHHDLLVVILRGQGSMLLGDEERPVGKGSILYVPRGTPHAFRNESDEPAVAYAVYSPAFDSSDRVPLD